MSELRVRAKWGRVEIVGRDAPGVRVTETHRWTTEAPKAAHSVSEGGSVQLTSTCSKGAENRGGKCEVDFKVEVPRGAQVDAYVFGGPVALRGLGGKITVETEAGEVEGEELTGKQVSAKSGAGDVRLAFAAIPDRVVARATAGNGTVRVPRGSYNVKVDSDAGLGKIGVTQDRRSPHTIEVATGAGDFSIQPTS
ncbi:hypothetical protein D5H75_02450 [Bailinhaonella thermotolerans]|uniref:DUF4097 domain-containing protein n=1 Tax=Bailinhaonella thermotolerans TaxID=1070861 RepID=A0A3A4BVP0_9ACTN|nr:hypothetical protein D5H75_02450 [Bailinhaonella thermotolerans]